MDRSTENVDTVDEVLQAVEAPFKKDSKPSVFGPPSPQLGFGIIKSEYFQILEQPKRLPFFFHPFLSKDREIDVTGKKTYFTPHFYLNDAQNVPRRFFLNLDIQNVATGAVGGLMVGLATPQYFKQHGHLAKLSAQKWLRNVETGGASRFEKLAATSVITWRIMKRAAVGAILFDCFKRNADTQRDTDDWKNAAFAGGVSGAVFGLRGGLPTGIFCAAGYAACAALHKISQELDFWE